MPSEYRKKSAMRKLTDSSSNLTWRGLEGRDYYTVGVPDLAIGTLMVMLSEGSIYDHYRESDLDIINEYIQKNWGNEEPKIDPNGTGCVELREGYIEVESRETSKTGETLTYSIWVTNIVPADSPPEKISESLTRIKFGCDCKRFKYQKICRATKAVRKHWYDEFEELFPSPYVFPLDKHVIAALAYAARKFGTTDFGFLNFEPINIELIKYVTKLLLMGFKEYQINHFTKVEELPLYGILENIRKEFEPKYKKMNEIISKRMI